MGGGRRGSSMTASQGRRRSASCLGGRLLWRSSAGTSSVGWRPRPIGRSPPGDEFGFAACCSGRGPSAFPRSARPYKPVRRNPMRGIEATCSHAAADLGVPRHELRWISACSMFLGWTRAGGAPRGTGADLFVVFGISTLARGETNMRPAGEYAFLMFFFPSLRHALGAFPPPPPSSSPPTSLPTKTHTALSELNNFPSPYPPIHTIGRQVSSTTFSQGRRSSPCPGDRLLWRASTEHLFADGNPPGRTVGEGHGHGGILQSLIASGLTVVPRVRVLLGRAGFLRARHSPTSLLPFHLQAVSAVMNVSDSFADTD